MKTVWLRVKADSVLPIWLRVAGYFVYLRGSLLVLLLVGCAPERDVRLVGEWYALDKDGYENRLTFIDNGTGRQARVYNGDLGGVLHFHWKTANGVLHINELGEEGERGTWEAFTYRLAGQKELRIEPPILYKSSATVLKRR